MELLSQAVSTIWCTRRIQESVRDEKSLVLDQLRSNKSGREYIGRSSEREEISTINPTPTISRKIDLHTSEGHLLFDFFGFGTSEHDPFPPHQQTAQSFSTKTRLTSIP